MSIVCLYVLSLPEVECKGVKYDQILVCVDRLSGWIIARPARKGKLTAEDAAHLMLENGWETFGIPSIVTSDQGSQFIGQWF